MSSDKDLFMAKYGSVAHLDRLFASKDAYTQEVALDENPNITRQHVEIGHKSEDDYVRRQAFVHPHTTDEELAAAHEHERIHGESDTHYYLQKEMVKRKTARNL